MQTCQVHKHTEVSTWHFWHICKGPTDNQRMWESKSHAKELFKNLRSAQAQEQKPRAGCMRTDEEERARSQQPPPRHTRLGFEWGTQPTLLSSRSGAALPPTPVTRNNSNVSSWTETGSNYAKKLEESQG